MWIGTGIGINRLRPGLLSTEVTEGVKPLVISPNPIRYSVINLDLFLTDSDGQELVRVDVDIFDGRGRFINRVRTNDLGKLSWRPEDRLGRRLPSGVYLFRAMGFDENGERVPNGSGRLVLTP